MHLRGERYWMKLTQVWCWIVHTRVNNWGMSSGYLSESSFFLSLFFLFFFFPFFFSSTFHRVCLCYYGNWNILKDAFLLFRMMALFSVLRTSAFHFVVIFSLCMWVRTMPLRGAWCHALKKKEACHLSLLETSFYFPELSCSPSVISAELCKLPDLSIRGVCFHASNRESTLKSQGNCSDLRAASVHISKFYTWHCI